MGLALAQSIVAAVEVCILSVIMLKRDRKLFDMPFWGGLWRIVSVTGFTVVTASTFASLYPLGVGDDGTTVAFKLAFLTLLTAGVHLSVSSLFGLEEVRPVLSRIRRIILKPIKLPY
jgi:hypothetical protein